LWPGREAEAYTERLEGPRWGVGSHHFDENPIYTGPTILRSGDREGNRNRQYQAGLLRFVARLLLATPGRPVAEAKYGEGLRVRH